MGVIVPVGASDTGPKLRTLQLGLMFLLHHQGPVEQDRETLIERLADEMSQHRFGEATRQIVGIFQYQLKNWPNYWPPRPQKIVDIAQRIPANCPGDVDEETAEALNWLVETFSPSPSPPRHELQPAAILQKLQKRPSS